MEHVVKPMPDKMKYELALRRLNHEIYEKIHARVRTKFPEPKGKTILMLPEDFTGKDLKRAKKLMKGRKTK